MKTTEDKAKSYEYIENIARLIQRVRRQPDSVLTSQKKEGGEFFPLIGADFPERDGVRVFWQRVEHPTKTFPYKETLEKIDDIKKVSMAFFRGLTDIFRNKAKALLLLLFTKDIENTFLNLLQELDQILRDIRNKPEMFCRFVREVWRVFELEEQTDTRRKIKELVCHTLEYDDIYRYQFQYSLAKLDKWALIKNPVKEIERLFDILIGINSKENGLDVKWRKIKNMVWLLHIRPSLKREVVRFLINLNLNEIVLDEVDKYHAKKKYGIKWDFAEYNEDKQSCA